MKSSKFLLQTTAAITASALLLAGCSSSDEASNSSSSAQSSDKATSASAETGEIAGSDYAPTDYDDVKDGGTLTLATYEVPEQMNVFHADMTGPTRTLWVNYNPQVALYDENGEYYPNPEYVTNIKEETVDGNTVVTFDINEKATFNDGTPIDWTAWETTWQVNNGTNPNFLVNSTDGYERIATVARGENDKQAVVTFAGAYPWWKGLFNTIAHPALKDVDNFNSYVKEPHPEWGAGPFIPETFDFNTGQVVFVRNDKWWGRPAKLDKKIFRQMESQAALNAFKNNELDATSIASKERYAAISTMPGIEIRTATDPFLELNAKAPQLDDPAVREAIFRAIDRETLSKIRFNGLPYSETPPNSLVLYPFQEGYQDNLTKALGNDLGPEAASKILENAGYVKEGDYYAKDGKTLELRYTLFGTDEASRASATATQKMLKDAGINVTIDERPSAEFSDTIKQRDFDILPIAFRGSDPYGVAYFGQTYKSDSQLNLSGTGTAAFDEKIKELQELPTAEEQIKRANELETEAFELWGLLPFANGAQIVAVKEGLVNSGAVGFSAPPIEAVGWKK
ncbi:ABC transporter family substrate-binding protein [Corynebacterium choanae]|uniref:ABC transporter family substrate-binding protein n=1 Tax=Corynebacterium choanae TaxID=1862358 RepID=UPI001FE52117|nr:ABC transporter family substrate-binding protein [Corynebacterium choanae]